MKDFFSKHNITKLYHATFIGNWGSIEQHGLGANVPKKIVYEGMSKNNITYLASSEGFAYQFCETAQEHSDDEELWQEIIVFEINISDLDMDCLEIDLNHPSDEPTMKTFTYSKPIPYSFLSKVDY